MAEVNRIDAVGIRICRSCSYKIAFFNEYLKKIEGGLPAQKEVYGSFQQINKSLYLRLWLPVNQ